MVGLAKKMFLESVAGVPKIFAKAHNKGLEWPLLEKALQNRCLSFADLAMSKRLLRNVPEADEAAAALLCHLSAASRKGHLCASIAPGAIHPPVQDIWTAGNEVPAGSDEIARLWQAITDKIAEGCKTIAPLLDDGRDQASGDCFAAVYRYGNLFYLQRYWKLENAFIENLSPLLAGRRPSIEVAEIEVKLKVDELLSLNRVLKQQAEAILQGCLHPFTVIIGGPGTGKTHTAGLLIKVLWESLSLERRGRCKIALAAPTGKAAANLEGSIQKAMQTVEGFPKLKAQTLHSLLGVGKSAYSPPAISADVLLVDECSMIDVQMMALLMKSLKPGGRLIMLGDRHQLPPVEAGSLFATLVEVLQESQKYSGNVIELETCLRAELASILDLAKSVNAGNAGKTMEILEGADQEKGLHFVPLQPDQNPKELQRQLLAYCLPKFPMHEVLPQNPLEILNEFSHFRMLTPLRKGLFGIEALNQLFFEAALSRSSRSNCFFAPIMIQNNDYRSGLFNGEVGLLVKIRLANGSFQHKLNQNDYALFASKSDDPQGVRKIPALLLPKFDYAYCLSIHKSQGSEFEHVLLLLPEGSDLFGREALYTGVTRARRKLEVWSNGEVIQRMIERCIQRHSGLKARSW